MIVLLSYTKVNVKGCASLEKNLSKKESCWSYSGKNRKIAFTAYIVSFARSRHRPGTILFARA
jgi:hypothetical protein